MVRLLPLCLVTSAVVFSLGVSAPRSVCLPCKYSVRDVAFVNVHGKAWQLNFIRSKGVEDDQIESWSRTLKEQLAGSNVGFTWLASESEEAVELRNRCPDSIDDERSFEVYLEGPSRQVIPIQSKFNSFFVDDLNGLLTSQSRMEIIERVVRSLCVVVLVESGDTQKDEEAQSIVSNAIEKLNRQMWTLEKPTDEGPALVVVPANRKSEENWLIRSLGVESTESPKVLIVYGQGRVLGEPLSEKKLSVSELIGRMSLCGSDCECDLNRDWLYGQQMIHVWNQRLEREVEQTLDFDPQSAFVVAEVSQIIQKNVARNDIASEQRLNLGGGLVIHDLDSESSTFHSVSGNPAAEDSNAQSNVLETGTTGMEHRETVSTPSSEQSEANGNASVNFPWGLIGAFSAVALVITIWIVSRAGV